MGDKGEVARFSELSPSHYAHSVTNAASEGVNSEIQTLKKMAYGFRRGEHFKITIDFQSGGFQLYRLTHEKAGCT